MSFKELFRKSKLASVTYRAGAISSTDEFPQHVPGHILTSPAHWRELGEWGVKRSLPPDLLRPRAVIVRSLDHYENGSRKTFRTASKDISEMTRWRELFGYNESIPEVEDEPVRVAAAVAGNALSNSLSAASVPKPASTSAPIPFNLIGQRSYKELLERTRALRAEWQEGSSMDTHTSWDKFLNVTPSLKPSAVHPPFYLVSPQSRNNATPGYDNLLRIAVSPEAQHEQVSSEYRVVKDITLKVLTEGVGNLPLLKTKVKARFLNTVTNGYAFGVLGFVAFVPKGSAPIKAVFSSADRSLQELHITAASFDHLGRPEILLATRDPFESNSPTLPSGRYGPGGVYGGHGGYDRERRFDTKERGDFVAGIRRRSSHARDDRGKPGF
ncbi:hypothetical protein HK101_010723 [Irineochytrium annulatum]|nr:hypothetical protein HK101_010723 [Irineochytrium annulatum]